MNFWEKCPRWQISSNCASVQAGIAYNWGITRRGANSKRVQETSWLVKLHKRIKAMKSTKSISLHILGEHQSLRLAVLLLKLSCPGWLQKGLLPIFKNTEKIRKTYNPKIQNQNCRVWKIQLVGSYFFFVFWFLISKSEHGVGSLAYFWICLFFVFCIFEPLGSYFFLYFVFLKLLIRIFFVFCIFEQLHSYFVYFVCMFFVFFLVKIQKNTKQIQIKYKKYTLYFCIFLYFSITSKNAICIFVCFLYFSSPSQIALCPFVFFAFFRHAVKEQNRESINVCCIFLLLIILPCSVLYFFL